MDNDALAQYIARQTGDRLRRPRPRAAPARHFGAIATETSVTSLVAGGLASLALRQALLP